MTNENVKCPKCGMQKGKFSLVECLVCAKCEDQYLIDVYNKNIIKVLMKEMNIKQKTYSYKKTFKKSEINKTVKSGIIIKGYESLLKSLDRFCKDVLGNLMANGRPSKKKGKCDEQN